jgi:hypothetical protein
MVAADLIRNMAKKLREGGETPDRVYVVRQNDFEWSVLDAYTRGDLPGDKTLHLVAEHRIRLRDEAARSARRWRMLNAFLFFSLTTLALVFIGLLGLLIERLR